MNIVITVDSSQVDSYVEKTLRNLELMPDYLARVLGKDMQIALGYAQIYAPVDKGKLRDNIHLELEGENSIALVSNVINDYGAPYAIYNEARESYVRRAVDDMLPELVADLKGTVMDLFKV